MKRPRGNNLNIDCDGESTRRAMPYMKKLFQFRLSTLMAATLLVGCLFGYVARHAADFQNEQRLTDQLLDVFDGATSVGFNKTSDGRTVCATRQPGIF